MIRGMVARLDAELARQPDNLAGWKRLVRSYMVLGEPAKAKAALGRALEAFPAASDGGKELTDAGDEASASAERRRASDAQAEAADGRRRRHGVLAVAVLLVLFALSSDIIFFRTPSDLAAERRRPATRIRLGGLVEPGTVVRGKGTEVTFAVTDRKHSVKVVYDGILPDLFREGQGVVAEGSFSGGGDTFVADTVLAKHDENYMPKEVADALKESGVW